MRGSLGVLVIVVCVGAGEPAAQPADLVDGFEASGLLRPSGQWDQVVAEDPADTVQVSSGAARSGQSGLRLINITDGGAGALGLIRNISSSGVQAVRVWYRPTAVAPGGSNFDSVLAVSRSNAFFTACQLTLSTGQLSWRVLAFNQDNTSQVVDLAPATVVPGQWYRVEMEAGGMGAPVGWCRVAVDGVELANFQTDWSMVSFAGIWLGAINSGATMDVTHDFDDFEASSAPFDAGPGSDAGFPADAGVDGGLDETDAGPRPDALAVNCGCHQPGSTSVPLWVALLAMLAWRRASRGPDAQS